MGLLELTTNLKSLKYEGPNKPLITKDINDPPKTGGISMQANHRIDDLVRHTKLLTKKPGLKFLGNQALLAQTDMKKFVKAQKGKKLKAIAKAVGKKALDTLENTALATASVLAQIPVNGTGTHFVRGFKKASGTYLDVHGMKVSSFSAPDGTIIPNIDPNEKSAGTSFVDSEIKTTKLGDTSKNTFYQTDPTVEVPLPVQNQDYLGTNHDARERASRAKEGKLIIRDNDGSEGYNSIYEDFSKLKDKENANTSTIKGTFGTQAQPVERTFKQRPDEIKDEDTYLQKKYGNETTGIVIKGNDKARKKREEGLEDKPDAVQSLEVQTSTILGSDNEDIIPFEFNTFYPGNTEGNFLYFRAFLSSFNDNYSGDWAGTRYVGRGEEMFNYQGFSRDISFDFKIAAFSKADIVPLYNKLNLLAGSTAPTYGDGQFMRGTLTKVTVGDYLKQTTGFISSIGLSWDPNTSWELEGDKRLPHVLDVNVAFTPIHDFVPTAESTFIG